MLHRAEAFARDRGDDANRRIRTSCRRDLDTQLKRIKARIRDVHADFLSRLAEQVAAVEANQSLLTDLLEGGCGRHQTHATAERLVDDGDPWADASRVAGEGV